MVPSYRSGISAASDAILDHLLQIPGPHIEYLILNRHRSILPDVPLVNIVKCLPLQGFGNNYSAVK